MRRISSLLGIVALLGLAACAQAVTRWEKAQVTEEATAADLQDCRVQADREASRAGGLYAGNLLYGPPFYRGWRYDYAWQARHEQQFTENRLTSFCMRNKGYERVTVETPKT